MHSKDKIFILDKYAQELCIEHSDDSLNSTHEFLKKSLKIDFKCSQYAEKHLWDCALLSSLEPFSDICTFQNIMLYILYIKLLFN